ncbi:MAG: hypothetical protein ACUVVU_02460 [Tepidimonas sp.]
MLTARGKPNAFKSDITGALGNSATPQEIQDVRLHAGLDGRLPAAVEAFGTAVEAGTKHLACGLLAIHHRAVAQQHPPNRRQPAGEPMVVKHGWKAHDLGLRLSAILHTR